ncbi:MAG: anthranilate phosphoribosyltransferase [bacterium]|nr:anthranilate phosphoribosyltransferase [bacterium]
MLREYLEKVINNNDLSQQDACKAMEIIMSGKATESQISSFITALRMKGETVDEITGFVETMRRVATRINIRDESTIDTCGTGGDGKHTLNVSTISAFVAAGAGVPVAKHGNRAASSKCGSADVLKALGVNIDIGSNAVEECVSSIGIGFLFAPRLHKAMIYAIKPRKEIGFRTVFNLLGPLTNPAGVKRQLVGVFNKSLTEPLASVLKNLGSKRVFVVHGHDGMDELSITGPTYVSELKDGKVSNFEIRPDDLGIARRDLEEITGGDIDTNKEIFLNILSGVESAGRDFVLMNAGAAIAASDDKTSIKAGVEKARISIDSGSALRKLNELIELTNSLK